MSRPPARPPDAGLRNVHPQADGARGEDIRGGILASLGYVAMFSVLNALVKWLGDDYSVVQIAFFRSAFALIPIAMMVHAAGGLHVLKTGRPLAHAWRGVIGGTTMLFFFTSFTLLPLAEATAISFAYPLVITLLAIPLLGERVGVHRLSAVIAGFIGVLVITRPSPEMLLRPEVVPGLIAVFGQALAMIQVRFLGRTEHPLAIVFWFTLTCMAMTGIALPFFWVTPDLFGLSLLIACGLVGGVGQYFLTRAFGLAPAAIVAPMSYGVLIGAIGFGWLIWSEIPDPVSMAGAALVIASGIYITLRERLRGRQPTPGGMAVSPAVAAPQQAWSASSQSPVAPQTEKDETTSSNDGMPPAPRNG